MAEPDPFLPPRPQYSQRISVRRTDVPGDFGEAFGAGGGGLGDGPGESERRRQVHANAFADQERQARLYEALVTLTPRADVTRLLLAANIGLYLLMVVVTRGQFTFDSERLVRWGADYGPLTTGGQWWRLLTATFLHVEFLHLAGNMLILWAAGPFVERLLGRAGFAVAFLLSGLAGSVASVWHNPNVVGVGASGAIFGIFGALVGFLVLRRDSIPREMLVGLLRNVLFFVALEVALEVMQPRVDMRAHLGGFAGGLLCGLALSQPITTGIVRRRMVRNVALLLAGSLALVVLAWRMPRAAADAAGADASVTAADDPIGLLLRQMVTLDQHRVASLKAAQTPGERADVLEQNVIPAWRAIRGRLAMLPSSRPADRDEATALARYMDLQAQAWQARADAIHEEDATLDTRRRLAKLDRRASQAWREFADVRKDGA